MNSQTAGEKAASADGTTPSFSDKGCAFRSDIDVSVAWPRWYRSAIDKSARQLAGAEKFLKAYPKRVFLDKGCQAPLPIELPSADVARYYLIAVTRGSHFPARQFFGGGSSGSVMLLTDLVGKADHEKTPFQVGFPLESRRFVHVLDEMTVDLLLEELDTVPDLVTYLRKKEEFLQRPNTVLPAHPALKPTTTAASPTPPLPSPAPPGVLRT